MGFVVLALGVLMVVAGAYEMVSGSGDILSERGWSAYIAGSVLVGSGAITSALGLTLRAIDRLRLRGAAAVATPVTATRQEPDAAAAMPLDLAVEPTSHADHSPATPALAAPAGLALAEIAAHAHEPAHLHEPAYAHEPAHVIEPLPLEPHADPAPVEPHPVELAAPEPEHHEPHVAQDHAPVEAPATQEDWLDHSFAELEREMAGHHLPAPHVPEPAAVAEAPHPEPHEPAPVAVPDPEPAPHPAPELHAAHHEEPAAHGHDASEPDGAVVSAREVPTSAIIGRYESEGTSYVMYADGSIDAQSEAGVYRFASMAELKAFIES